MTIDPKALNPPAAPGDSMSDQYDIDALQRFHAAADAIFCLPTEEGARVIDAGSGITAAVRPLELAARESVIRDFVHAYPAPEELAKGPSYIAVGYRMHAQAAALRLFFLGEALGLWQVMTPERLGLVDITTELGKARNKALIGQGFVVITGYTIPTPADAPRVVLS